MRVARIFNTYGPKMHMYDGKEELGGCEMCSCLSSYTTGRVVSNFIIQALQNQTLTVR